jgi:chromosome segregation ATPase
MPESQGFIDLRIGHGAIGVGDDSVWPSFTDVMTVIVMIFLMALVVIMVRNFELDRQLLSTLSAKEATSLANQELIERLTMLESSLGDTQEQRDLLKASLELELDRLAALAANTDMISSELEAVTKRREQLEQANTLLEQKQESAMKEISALTESELSLHQQIDNLQEQFSKLELASSEKISGLTGENQSLNEKLDTVSAQLAEVKLFLKGAQFENKSLTQEVAELESLNLEAEERYSIASDQIEILKELIQQRETEITALQSEAETSIQEFRSLQEEYDSLDVRYRKLIRPARSTAGKQVVEVWIEKFDTGYRYQIKEPGQVEATVVDREQMDRQLQALKDKFGSALYTRIVIPEDSALTYNEAWDFTQEILQKYDYYHQ